LFSCGVNGLSPKRPDCSNVTFAGLPQ
jgi:hypothetical protein